MKILAVGINHKTSPIAIREKFFLAPLERRLLLSAFNNDPGVMAAVILSTCNRCEIYAHVDDEYQPHEILKKLFFIKRQPQVQEVEKLFYVLQGSSAVEHLLRVACGLDSLILGEKQIFGQIKDALLLSRQNQMMDKTFNVLANVVLETGKKVRRETAIDFGGSSVSWAAVMMAQNILGSLEGKTVLMLGSGKMGCLAVEQLLNKRVKQIYLMNRTLEKAQELARSSGATAVSFWDIKEILPQVDVCICSASCTHYLIDKELVENAMRLGRGQKFVCIDISVPRNIDPRVAQAKDVCLLTVDDLDRVVEDNIQKRLGAVEQAEKIVLQKTREFYQVLDKIHLMQKNVGICRNYSAVVFLVMIFGSLGAGAVPLSLADEVKVDGTLGSSGLPAAIKGAKYVGTDTCAACHVKEYEEFKLSTHARISPKDVPEGTATGCEMCHGPGSVHVDNGGGKGNIINPGKNPEACFVCHTDKKMEFRLPYHHPVLEGKMSCTDCHDAHAIDIRPWAVASQRDVNEVCFKCHTDKRGPFIWEHEAMKEGCTVCHKVHGSVNANMLIARDYNLCLRCHATINFPNMGTVNHTSYMSQGTCWSAGCHMAVHGSNANSHLHY